MTEAAYIFPGQGAQYVGMGRDFYENIPASREIYEKANTILGRDIARLCFEGPKDELTKTENSQLAIFVTSIAALTAFELKYKDRFTPKFAAGLSLGEITAVVAAGAVSFEDALTFVQSRAKFMEDASRQNPGKMAAIMGLEIKVVEEVCKETGAEIANLNCPGQVVVSGKSECVERAALLAKEKGAKRAILLDVSGPFHSSLMSSAGERLAAVVDKLKVTSPRFPVVSNVTAKAEMSPDEIRRNLIIQVSTSTRWEESMRYIASCGVKSFFEIGPGSVLKGLMKRIDDTLGVTNIENMESLNHENSSSS